MLDMVAWREADPLMAGRYRSGKHREHQVSSGLPRAMLRIVLFRCSGWRNLQKCLHVGGARILVDRKGAYFIHYVSCHHSLTIISSRLSRAGGVLRRSKKD
jgi:hypothetical protein